MYVFFDTEFTQLSHEAKLISIGMISEDGREFYAELSDTWRHDDCSEFVLREVTPHLEGGHARISVAMLCLKLGNWLESFEIPVSLVSDATTWDWPWINYIFHDQSLLPENLVLKPIAFMPNRSILMQKQRDLNLRKHHALDDARLLRWAWLENQPTR